MTIEKQRMVAMANRVAKGEVNDPALEQVETGLDHILMSIQVIEENLPKITTATPEEESAKAKMIDLFDTGVNPYFADILKEVEVFTGENKEE